jgi:putative peptide zinc metalloprotease protein
LLYYIVMSISLKELKQAEVKYEGETYFALRNGLVFKLGEVNASFIKYYKNNSYEFALSKSIQEVNLDKEQIKFFEESLQRLNDKMGEGTQKKKYVKFSFTLLSQDKVRSLSKKLKFLFSKEVVILLTSLAIVLNLFFLFSFDWSVFNTNLSQVQTILFPVFIFLIAIIHELGHSTASEYFGVKPKEIGFGFYIVFPVLYSNVTEIWLLHKNDRVLVNLAGIYFQLLISISLMILWLFYPNNSFRVFIDLLLLFNIFIILYALIPFIRNDGYWILSDYLEIPDLNKQSNTILAKILCGNIKSIESKGLLIYSIFSNVFILYISYHAVLNLYQKLLKFEMVNFPDFKSFVFDNYVQIFSIGFSCFILFILSKSLIKFISTLKLELK